MKGLRTSGRQGNTPGVEAQFLEGPLPKLVGYPPRGSDVIPILILSVPMPKLVRYPPRGSDVIPILILSVPMPKLVGYAPRGLCGCPDPECPAAGSLVSTPGSAAVVAVAAASPLLLLLLLLLLLRGPVPERPAPEWLS